MVVGVITIWSGTNEGVDVIISVNMGGRAEVMFIKALETGGVNSKYSNANTTHPLACPFVDTFGLPLS